MGSTRLPGKMLLELNNQPVVSWIYLRMKRCKMLHQLVFAIPQSDENDILEKSLRSMGADVIRGSENDVLDRYIKAINITGGDNVIRICGDNPLISWEAVDLMVQEHLSNQADYTYNHIPLNNLWPDGLGAEICKIEMLYKLNKVCSLKEDREHIFNYLHKTPNFCKIHTFDPPKSSWKEPKLKLDLDTVKDYENLIKNKIYPEMTIDQIIDCFKK